MQTKNEGHDETPEGNVARDVSHAIMPEENKSPTVHEIERELMMMNMHGMTMGGKGGNKGKLEQLEQDRREWLDSRYELKSGENGAAAVSSSSGTRPSPYPTSARRFTKAMELISSLHLSQSQSGGAMGEQIKD